MESLGASAFFLFISLPPVEPRMCGKLICSLFDSLVSRIFLLNFLLVEGCAACPKEVCKLWLATLLAFSVCSLRICHFNSAAGCIALCSMSRQPPFSSKAAGFSPTALPWWHYCLPSFGEGMGTVLARTSFIATVLI